MGFVLHGRLALGKFGTETDLLSLADGESSSFDASSVRMLTGYAIIFPKDYVLELYYIKLRFFFFIGSWFHSYKEKPSGFCNRNKHTCIIM